MKIRCYMCEKETDKLYPMKHLIGRMNAEIYVCRECLDKENERNEDE